MQNMPHQEKTKKVVYAPSKDSEQPGRLPSLIRDLAAGMAGTYRDLLSYPLSTEQRL